MFFCEICEIFKNTFFTEHLPWLLLDNKNCSCKKCPSAKLVLACEYEILNTTKTSFDDKKVTCNKKHSYDFIGIYMLVISDFHYTRDWIKKECALPY